MNQREKVFVILYPNCISYEVSLAAELLSQKYEIINATPDGQDLTDGSGLPLKSQLSYDQVSLDACKAILVPGGDPGSIVENKVLDNILIDAHEKQILLGAVCAGPLVLAKAGILKGRKIAHGYGPEQLDFLKDFFKEVELTQELFVIEDNIITAKPEAHIDFGVEIGCRLNVVDPSKSGRLKEYYRGTLGKKIRPVALALIKNDKGQILLHKAKDAVKNEIFYRPLGGGIEFHESGRVALVREFEEELGLEVKVIGLKESFENMFTYEGIPGHEIVLLFEAEFTNRENYQKRSFDIVESGKVIGTAEWRSLEEINNEGAKLYPKGIEQILS